jgi:uncharacterized protein
VSIWTEILGATDHRPYPLPEGRVRGTMSWHDLSFMHYRVSASELRALVPARLELDLWEGQAWVGVVPFFMSHVGVPGFNQVPWLSAFEELNVRTYVTRGGKAGVYFFSLDAACWPAVLGARAGFRLPYYWAHMQRVRCGAEVSFRSQRLVGPPARFEARYRPTSGVRRAARGSFEHWLTERYCLYTVARDGSPLRCDVHHPPWPLQDAEADIVALDMTVASGLRLLGPPVLHFASRIDVLAWLPEPA